MADEDKTEAAGQESHDGSSGEARPAAEQARTEHRSEPAQHFDHAKAWDEIFKRVADLPESIINSLREEASSKKREEKEPEEKVVQQETPEEKIESPVPQGKEKEQTKTGNKAGWGHRWFLEPRKPRG